MRLKKLIENLDSPRIINLCDFPVNGIACDSKSVKDNYVFVAIKGTSLDGHLFIGEAIRKGAKAIICQRAPARLPIPEGCSWITVKDTRQALARLAQRFYGHPSGKMKVIGITGTNGKTTTSYLLESLLNEAGFKTAVIGTINYRFGSKVIPACNTTPGPLETQSLLSGMQRAGVGFVVMEVSSHALAQERVSSVDFSYAIFTNLTHDHLDYHLNMDAYFKAKARLFKAMPKNTVSIFNIDDPYARRLLNMTRSRVITYGLGSRAMVSARDIRFSIRSTRFIAKTPKATIEITSPLIGRHNLYNVLAAISLGTAVGLRPDTIKNAIAKFKPVPGRLERVDRGGDFSVFVDYAHTDDALKNVLTTLKELTASRIIVVFGCGGNRDKAKRPKMGRVASELSDFAIITSDNPRNESPRDIIADILSGITTKNFKVIADRRAAILGSIKMARPGDVILIAGKGHETRQIFKNRSIHFDDRETVRQCLELMS